MILTDDLTDQFTVSYEELLPYLSVAILEPLGPSRRRLPRPPYTYGSKVSRLTRALAAGHHDVKLADEERERISPGSTPTGPTTTATSSRELSEAPAADLRRPVRTSSTRSMPGGAARATGRPTAAGNWWLSLNRRDVSQSRMLAAPLARSAGGWQRCGDPVFADTADADYKKLLAGLAGLGERLSKEPRADLLSIRGTEAERQELTLLPPHGHWHSSRAAARPASAAATSRRRRRDHDHPHEEPTMLNQDQVCIVTGGGKGIGKGIAKVLAAEGATVVVAGRSEDLLRQTAADIVAGGGQAAAWRLDITDRPGVAAFVQQVRQQFGRIDVLVNNAGLMPLPGNLATFDDQLWDDLFAVNATGTYNMTKAVLPAMSEQKSGRIVNISSISAKLTWPAFVAYGAAKAALHAFTTALAKEVAADGITVNCVLPGFTRTEEMERIWGTIAHSAGKTMDELVNPILESKVPIKRWLRPEEIGYMVSFLASPRRRHHRPAVRRRRRLGCA